MREQIKGGKNPPRELVRGCVDRFPACVCALKVNAGAGVDHKRQRKPPTTRGEGLGF